MEITEHLAAEMEKDITEKDWRHLETTLKDNSGQMKLGDWRLVVAIGGQCPGRRKGPK